MKKHWYDLNKFMFCLICLIIEISIQVIEILPSYVFLKLLSNNFGNLETYFKVGLIFCYIFLNNYLSSLFIQKKACFYYLSPCCLNSHWYLYVYICTITYVASNSCATCTYISVFL